MVDGKKVQGLYKIIDEDANKLRGGLKVLLIVFSKLQILNSKFKHQDFYADCKNISDTRG
ncbi:MAG TPA: hypothetical protein VE944_08570 [Nostoc sp.]|uniref:hypothetical protein n=1 Tax=Nostoc sp. TaxID=1180 RepID=UPI002D55D0ED|nr:hypothetical protein [Nostoc sp.]HYX14409.1 hypothetical protein [Nostoc sp.]